MTAPAKAANGFTLVEVLIALSIFAMLAVTGVMLLRSSITTQAGVARQLGDTSEVMRLRAILASEMMAASPRPSRDASGQSRPAMVGTASAMALVHSNDTGAVGSISRATYRLDDGRLVRDGEGRVDGTSAATTAVMVRDVTSIAWRYRGIDGSWTDQWTPDRPDRLPVAVELTLARQAGPPITMAFLVAPDGLSAGGDDANGGPN